MNRSLLLLAAALLVVGAGSMVGTGTQAAFTDITSAPANTFATGTIDLSLAASNQDCDNVANTYTDALSNASLFADTLRKPGQVTTTFVCTKNVGTLPLQVSLGTTITDTIAGSDPLLDAIKMRIIALTPTESITATACSAGLDNEGADIAPQTNGTAVLATVDLNPNPSFSASGTTLLAAGEYMRFCISLVMPLTATVDSDPAGASTIQGQTATAAFTFTGNQT